VIPQDELSLCVELGGVKVGLTHGHLFSSGGRLVQAKALEWWRGQVFGLQPVAEAQVLVSSHFHHFSVINHGARTHIQTPAMDPGSKWVANAWGTDSPAGVLTLRYDAEHPLGWADLHVLGAGRA
jgi:predicted phosphodiesterase